MAVRIVAKLHHITEINPVTLSFRTEQGHCGACRRKRRLTDTDLCPCGETQTMWGPTLSNPVP